MPDDLGNFVQYRARERAREQAQARRDYDAEIQRQREQASTWTRILAKPVASEPAPEPTGPTPEQVQQLTNEEWSKARSALLGVPDHASDFAGGTTSWADRREATLAAQATLRSQPDAQMEQFLKDRAEAGIKSSNSTILGVESPNPRTHQSPWTG